MALILLFLAVIVVITVVTFIAVALPMFPLLLFSAVIDLILSLPGGEQVSEALTKGLSFLGMHPVMIVVLTIIFLIIAFLFDDLFNVIVRAIWLCVILYAIYPSKIMIALVVVFSIASLGYSFYNTIPSLIVYVGAASPVLFILLYYIFGMILRRDYDYIFHYTEDSHPTIVLLTLVALFVTSFIFFFKMCKRSGVKTVKECFLLKHLNKLYKPCVLITFVCVILMIVISVIVSYRGGVFDDTIATIKILSILGILTLIFIIEFIASRRLLCASKLVDVSTKNDL